jgi:hypothetical protein
MEKETFLSGYCRVLDQSRMVAVVTEDGELLEADCCFGNCVHEPNCQIAAKIRELLEQ